MKRLWRQPAYLALLILIPILGWAVGRMEQGEQEGVRVAVCVEEGEWSGQIKAGLQDVAADSILQFIFCEDETETERDVIRGDVDCGFVIAGEIMDRIMNGDWSKSIAVYETSASSITGMAQERISGVFFKLYSEQKYEDYMWETASELSETKDFVDFARRAYESHLVDGSTFDFQYVYDDHDSQHISDANVRSDTVVFPVKGVFAVIIFISGMCGMLEYDTDRREKRFLRMAPNILTYIVDVWIPTVFVSVAVLICLWVSDGLVCSAGADAEGKLSGLLSVWSVGMWGRQILHLVIYQGIVVIYCCVLGIVLRRQETIAVSIPILSLGSLVCAPVFIRLATYMPIFTVLEKMFPVTYYLMLGKYR